MANTIHNALEDGIRILLIKALELRQVAEDYTRSGYELNDRHHKDIDYILEIIDLIK
jgi:hypothetical protein